MITEAVTAIDLVTRLWHLEESAETTPTTCHTPRAYQHSYGWGRSHEPRGYRREPRTGVTRPETAGGTDGTDDVRDGVAQPEPWSRRAEAWPAQSSQLASPSVRPSVWQAEPQPDVNLLLREPTSAEWTCCISGSRPQGLDPDT